MAYEITKGIAAPASGGDMIREKLAQTLPELEVGDGFSVSSCDNDLYDGVSLDYFRKLLRAEAKAQGVRMETRIKYDSLTVWRVS